MWLERTTICTARGGVLAGKNKRQESLKSGWDWALHSHRGLWGIYQDISFQKKTQIIVDFFFFLCSYHKVPGPWGGWKPLLLYTMGVILLLTLWTLVHRAPKSAPSLPEGQVFKITSSLKVKDLTLIEPAMRCVFYSFTNLFMQSYRIQTCCQHPA